MTERKRILIIDDHPLFREGLKAILARDDRFEVVGEAGSAVEGKNKAQKLNPEIILMDISLPDQNGIELTKEIKRKRPESRVLVISMHSKIDLVTEAFQAGALGYIIKESATDTLLQALHAISKDEHYLDSSISRQVVQKLIDSPLKKEKITDAAYASLTSREQEVMRLVAEGFSVKKIAEKLFISPKTVENHRSSIMKKLDLHSSHELIRYAAKLGLIDVDLWKQ
jgi:DNA-binding NarL/FixJ family response regulator